MQRICIALAALAAPLLVSCIDTLESGVGGGTNPGGSDSGSATGSGTGAESALDTELIDLAATYKSIFTQINTTPDKSSLGDFDINLFVYGDVSDYQRIHPETASTSPAIAIGTIIVREVLDSSGNIAKLTIMAKGPTGYDPSLGDWWFAEAQADGQPFVDNGLIRVGKLDDCHGCHVPRESEDYMFGVPQADQAHKQ